jgi:hypothetical protein
MSASAGAFLSVFWSLIVPYTMILSIFAAALFIVPSVNAFWRLPCAKPILDARVDPIVSPGKPSSHSHTVMGSSGAHVSRTAALKVNPILRVSHWAQH